MAAGDLTRATGDVTSDLTRETDALARFGLGDAAHRLGARSAQFVRTMRTPILAWFVHLVVVLSASITTVILTPHRDKQRPDIDRAWDYVVKPLSMWDGGWYIRLAQHGYAENEMSAAFWPLYPLLLDVGHQSTGSSLRTVGVLLSNVFFLGALILFFRFVGITYGQSVSTRAVWFIALSPLSFYFSAVYTESLYLFLVLLALSLAYADRWTAAALTAGLVALTRNNGAMVFAPLIIMLISQRGWNPRGWWTCGIQLFAAALAPVAFLYHLDRVWGDPFLTARVQSQWGRIRTLPWETLGDAIHRMHRIYATGRHSCELRFSEESFHTCRNALELKGANSSDDISFAVVAGVIALVPFAIWRLRPWDSAYLFLGLLFPLFGPTYFDPLWAMSRYTVVLYPVPIVIALIVRWRPLFLAMCVVSALAMAGLVAMFVQRYFVA